MIARRRLLVPTLALLAGLATAEDAVQTTVGDTITVQSKGEEPLVSGTKTATDPLLQPQSISSISETTIREQHAIKLEEVIRNVAGVTVGGYYNDWDYYRIRGFDAADSTRYDGLFASPGIWITPDVFGAESVDVVKGPASMLYGRSSLGGMVNIISKKPKHDDFATVSLSAGNEHFGELGVDGGTTFANGDVGVRLVALARNRGSFVNGVDDSKRFYVAPSLTWWLDEQTTLTLLTHFQKDNINAAWPLPAKGFINPNQNGSLPYDLNVGEPGYQSNVDNKQVAVGYELQHRFNDQVALRQNLRVSHVIETFQGIYPSVLESDERTLERTVYGSDNTYNLAQVDTMLDLHLVTGAVKHDALLGLDAMTSTLDGDGTYAAIANLDLFDPQYGSVPGAFTTYTDSRETVRSLGVYLQDQATVTEQITLTGGVRLDTVGTRNLERTTDVTTTSRDNGFTWRIGAVYQFDKQASAFTSYSTSFTPQPYNTDANGDRVDPETGQQIEAGLRTIDRDGRYNGTVAVFQITRQHVATTDPSNPLASLTSGAQRSRGLELDGMLKPTDALKLTATYAFIKAVVTEDNAIPVGDRLLNVPTHSITTWAKYTLQEGPARGLGFGGGGRWYSSQAGDLPNTFSLPAYAVVDVGLFYDRGPVSAQLNIDNLLDHEYAVGSYNNLYVLPGDPRTIRGTVSYTF